MASNIRWAGALAVIGVAFASGYTWTEHWSPDAKSKDVVRRALFDPDSAQFKSHFRAQRGGDGVWCGEVNAKNRLGGMVGVTRYIVEIDDAPNVAGLDPDLFTKVSFDHGDGGLDGKWKLMCNGH